MSPTLASVSPTGKDRRCAFEEFEAGEQAVDHGWRAEGAGGVVDEHRIAVDRGKAGADRIRALCAAFDKFADVDAFKRRRVRLSCWPVPTTTRRFARPDDGSSDSTAQRNTGFPPSSRNCLGTPPPMRVAFAGGDDECGGGHGARALGLLALSAKGCSTICRHP